MTDPDAPTAPLPRSKPRREPIRKPGPLTVIAGSLGLFLAITALLALQLRAGADPALGAGEPLAAATPAAPKVVIRRRVIVTRIVEHRPPRRAAAPTGAGRTQAAAPASQRSPAVPGVGAPAASAPAPANPAPAPLTTRSS